MKIQAIRISGFRGIPPVEPPDMKIELLDKSGNPANLVLFGPNAYGKSSVAESLEWFFTGQTRGTRLEGFSASDTVHLKTGKPKFQPTAYIELDIYHGGQKHTLRKEIDPSGTLISENLAGLTSEIQQARDEMVVLDHDRFREFVQAANKDKWSSFSSLIGYELLDQFRGGLDSVTQRSLSDRLQVNALATQLTKKQTEWKGSARQAIQKYGITLSSADDDLIVIRSAVVARIEILFSSFSLPVPATSDAVSEQTWTELRQRTQPNDAYREATKRLGELETLSSRLAPFDIDFKSEVMNFVNSVNALALKKEQFDKEILSEFYSHGLRIMQQRKTEPDKCPFCGSIYDWSQLELETAARQTELNFAGIKREQQALSQKWQFIKTKIVNKKMLFEASPVSKVQTAYQMVSDTSEVDRAITLAAFEPEKVGKWAQNCITLIEAVTGAYASITDEKNKAQAAIGNNPASQLSDTVESAYQLWKDCQQLEVEYTALSNLRRKKEIVDEVVAQLRNVAGQFRSELSDFSGRVVQVINSDVKKYYDALHPKDDIQPFLETEIVGTQRIVKLKCNYRGLSGKDAVSMLSESHRNSMGLAILLAFRHYKQKLGSAVEFCIFDDVTQSFDVGHRVNLLNFLEDAKFPEVNQQQILFLTHDRTLADLIKRSSDEELRPNWIRFDIRNWWIDRMLLEPCHDARQKAIQYIQANDEIAAAVYARQALEQVYKQVIKTCRIRVQYEPHPWSTTLDDYRKYIKEEIDELWRLGDGFIDPSSADFTRLFTSQRILNLTVHDSQFLENPMTMADVQAALDMVDDLRKIFSCIHCNNQTPPLYQYFPRLRKDRLGNPPVCRRCNNPVV